ncbi:MAG: FG-GAP-like repeat-containing protein [Polyangiales bacterium]
MRAPSTTTLWALATALAVGCGADDSAEEVNPSASDAIRASAPACGTPLGSFDGTTAYSNGANTGTGVSCAGSGAYGLQYQCVELVMRHFRTHWGLRWWGNARDLLNNAPRGSVDVFYNGDGAHPPVPGDLIVWQTGAYGHTALVTDVRSGAIDILEQNSGGGARATLPWNGSRIGARWGSWVPQGWAHARANRWAPAPPPPPTCTPHCEGNVYVRHDCGRTDCGAGSVCREDGGARCMALPRGVLDAAGCDEIRGWAQDPNTATAAVTVDLSIDGPMGSGSQVITVRADARRDDLCAALGSCDHAFSVDTPYALRDGREHQVFAYVRGNADPAQRPALSNAPRSFRCAAPRVADFNGDGRDDVVQFRGDASSVPVCVSLGSGWSCQNLAAPASDGWSGGTHQSAVLDGALPLLGRFNDDAALDLIEFRGGSERAPVCLSLGTGWSCRGLEATWVEGEGSPRAGSTPLVGDFNGDGRSDLIEVRADGAAMPVCLSLGTGWSCREMPLQGAGASDGVVPLVGDFNGDGRDDVIRYRDGGTTIAVCLSLGTGWSCRDLLATYAGGDAAGNDGSGVYAGSTPLVGDFNGDGRADLIQYRAGSMTLPVCLSLETGWSCRALTAALPTANAATGATAVLADLDRDGKTDLIQYDPHAQMLPVCTSLGTGWSCRDLPATLVGGDALGNGGSGVFAGGAPLVGDFNGDGRPDLAQFQSRGWTVIPVCLWIDTGWSCRALRADYTGGVGAGNDGSGVY